MTSLSKQRLAIFYGWPSGVNATYSVDGAINVFKKYHLVIFGAGLEDPNHGDHVNTKNIINGLIYTKVFGYIASTLEVADIKAKIDNWVTMGVAGIFCDIFGYDFGLTRSKQNEIVDYIHSKNLSAFVNAWNPDDVFLPDGNLLTHLGKGDWYLAESYQIINDDYQDKDAWLTKSLKLKGFKEATGVKLAAVTTTVSGIFDQAKFDYAYYSAILFNFDAFGWGEKDFSASTGSMPYRERKRVYGNKVISDIKNEHGVLTVYTNVGIKINTITRQVDYVI